MTYIETHANEESAYTVTVTLNFTPTTMTWTLTDEDGTVINSRSAVSVSSPSTTNTITLTGDDLALSDVKKTRRIFTVTGTYNSGANKFSDECQFDIDNLLNI